uniref:protein-serine/threonine phosphatase n=1 Tax=Calidris pygmaea TaxID=425635 RepID=A0A8C3PPP7_9CHAR
RVPLLYLPLRTRTDSLLQLPRRCDTSWAEAAGPAPQDSPTFLFLRHLINKAITAVTQTTLPSPRLSRREGAGQRLCGSPRRTATSSQPRTRRGAPAAGAAGARALTRVQHLDAAPVPGRVGAAEDPEARGSGGGQERGVLVARPQPAPAGGRPAVRACGQRRARSVAAPGPAPPAAPRARAPRPGPHPAPRNGRPRRRRRGRRRPGGGRGRSRRPAGRGSRGPRARGAGPRAATAGTCGKRGQRSAAAGPGRAGPRSPNNSPLARLRAAPRLQQRQRPRAHGGPGRAALSGGGPRRKRLPPSGPRPPEVPPPSAGVGAPRRSPEVPGPASGPEPPFQDGAAGPGQVRGDRAALQVPARERPQAPLRLRVRPAAGGVQRPARLHARHRLRGHPRAVLRPVRAVPHRRAGPRHQLHLHDECQTKYGNANAWRYCTKVFDMLTIAALIDEQILCVHGGLSPDIKTLDQIRTIERNQEIPHKGAFCDLVWSDPEDVDTWAISPRGAGWLFGAKVTNEVMLLFSARSNRGRYERNRSVQLSVEFTPVMRGWRALPDEELPL